MEPQNDPAIGREEAVPQMTAGTEYTRALTEALITMHGKKWGKRLIRHLAARMASQETFVTPIRPIVGAENAIRIHRESVALFQGHIPGFLALLDI
jgi:hypothetical protein